jgi:hypothetical protein
VPEIWERPPLTLKMSTAGSREVLTENLGASTINVKNIDSGPLGPREGVQSPFGIRKVYCDLHSHDRQKVILLTGLILLALSSIMVDDP